MRILRLGVAVLILLGLVIGGIVLMSPAPAIAVIEPPPRSAFDPTLMKRGAELAAIGNCAICHTAPGGAAFAGGRPIPTPFGTIYSTNITPAPGNGIGRWPEAAFRRAMREGISRGGRHLYPALPYDHFVKLDDADLAALYAFIMTRPPVDAFTPPNELPFPLGERWVLSLWNLLFLDRTPFRADPTKSAEWNRGAYLVQGLGHCGDCHTPRNLLGAEKTSEALNGGSAEGWSAPALNAASPAPLPWDEWHLAAYLRRGRDVEHGAAAGPMQPITADLAAASDADIEAIAAYLVAERGEISLSQRRRADAARARAAASELPRPAPGEEVGATIFAGACAFCHGPGQAIGPPHGISLALSTAVNDAEPRDAILILLDGIRPADGATGPTMPGFAGAFTDDQLAALLRYVRAHYGSGPAWTDIAAVLGEIRSGGRK